MKAVPRLFEQNGDPRPLHIIPTAWALRTLCGKRTSLPDAKPACWARDAPVQALRYPVRCPDCFAEAS